MAGLAGVLGFSLASVARNTSVALGAGFVLTSVVEPVIGGRWPSWRRWLLVDNVSLFVTGDEISFPPLERDVLDAAIVLALYGALAVGAALLAFRHRDVT